VTEPRWVRDIFATWLYELRAFFTTVAAFVGAPRRFGSEWSAGVLRAMNPVGFVLERNRAAAGGLRRPERPLR